MRSAADWTRILNRLGVKPSTAASWAGSFANEVRPEKFSLGETEIPDFISQVLHESGKLEVMTESLNYKVEALLTKFGRHRISEADARRYGRIDGKQKADQVALANILYGGEWGAKNLGNKKPGDGWNYRGSGPIQVTGLGNFSTLERITGIPLVANPDLLRKPGPEALRVCVAWWEGHVPDAVMGNVVRVRKSVNGGSLGLDDTSRLYALAKKELAA